MPCVTRLTGLTHTDKPINSMVRCLLTLEATARHCMALTIDGIHLNGIGYWKVMSDANNRVERRNVARLCLTLPLSEFFFGSTEKSSLTLKSLINNWMQIIVANCGTTMEGMTGGEHWIWEAGTTLICCAGKQTCRVVPALILLIQTRHPMLILETAPMSNS